MCGIRTKETTHLIIFLNFFQLLGEGIDCVFYNMFYKLYKPHTFVCGL